MADNQATSADNQTSNPHPTRTFIVPTKQIENEMDFFKWKTSKAYQAYLGFVLELNEAIKGKKLSDPCPSSNIVEKILSVLEQLSVFVDEIPPTTQPTRFGNKAYRTWYTKVEAESPNLMKQIVPEDHVDAVVELAPLFSVSFGNYQRIDYGTGHEAAFVTWLLALRIIGLLPTSDNQALVSKVFARYLKLMRKLQRTYMLEPAGSHGVWGIDDYQFLPFVWGSAQLIGNKTIKPKSIHEDSVLETQSDEYLYIGCIRFIKEAKKGPFGEHSPFLNDISFVPHQLWEKVNHGMIKMYQQECLNKFPVIQHFLFGSIIPFQ